MSWLQSRRAALAGLAGAFLALALSATSAAAGAGGYTETKLVSDQPGVAMFTDPLLRNAWGLVHGPVTPWWVSDNATGVSTLYKGDGTKVPLTVPVEGPACAPMSSPTGVVFNGTSSFNFLNKCGVSQHGRFIFSTEDGTIAAWNIGMSAAVTVVDKSPGAVYKGLAIGSNASGNFLYATNFRAGTVDVFDTNFNQVTLAGSFSDPGIMSGFAPFGIANLGGQLYVTYAKQDAAKHDDVAGPANGFVDVFDTNGNLVRRAATRGRLNSPWGVAIAPANFGRFSNDLLVGNFGDGRINVIDPVTGEFIDQLRDNTTNRAFTIDGLWAIVFGAGSTTPSGPSNTLFFTAGPNHEMDGLFGKIEPAS